MTSVGSVVSRRPRRPGAGDQPTPGAGQGNGGRARGSAGDPRGPGGQGGGSEGGLGSGSERGNGTGNGGRLPIAARRVATPPDRRALAPGVAPVLMRTLVAEAVRAGIDPETLCRGLGYTAADLDIPGAMVTRGEALALVRRAVPAFGSPTLGFDLGKRSNLANRGTLALGLLASATLGDALALLLRHTASAGLLVAVRELQTDAEFVLQVQPVEPVEPEIEAFLVDEFFASSVRLARLAAGGSCSPSALQLVREAPPDGGRYSAWFGCPVAFGCSENRLVCGRQLMTAPLPTASRMGYRLACQLLEGEAARSMGSTVVWATTRLLARSLADPPTPQRIAEMLYLSERTLRRRLTEAGTTYRGLLDQLRKARAVELVRESELALSAVADETGFTDSSNFRRAFVRWTGRTPSQMRRTGG